MLRYCANCKENFDFKPIAVFGKDEIIFDYKKDVKKSFLILKYQRFLQIRIYLTNTVAAYIAVTPKITLKQI